MCCVFNTLQLISTTSAGHFKTTLNAHILLLLGYFDTRYLGLDPFCGLVNQNVHTLYPTTPILLQVLVANMVALVWNTYMSFQSHKAVAQPQGRH